MKKGSRKAVVTSEVGLTKPAPAVVPKVNVQATDLEVEKWKGDILVVGLFEGSSSLGFEEEEENAGELKKLDDFVGGVLKEIASEEEFKGKVGQSSFARLAGYGFKRVGLGKLEAVVVEEGKTPSTKPWKGLGESVAAEDTRYKSEYKSPAIEKVELIGLGAGMEIQAQLSHTVQQCAGVLADEAENIATAHDDVLLAKILDKEECEALKMGEYLGVAAASSNPPKFIHFRYTPPSGNVKTKLAITGLGSMIEVMKLDMEGAAAAFGAAKAIASTKPLSMEVNFIVAASENMISGGGMRLVNHTDAEGRLTLADALVYAGQLKVNKIVDLATLTGACIVALGTDIGGIFTPSDELAEELSVASTKAGEKFWRMPMEEGYWELMKFNIADFVNTGSRADGCTQFVDEKLPWAHLDIAGSVWKDKTGGTGFAVSTLVEWVVKNSSA
ncbi:hypothetical protein CY35_07G109500 [Sphagnum magellanicum]|uniref:Uncharacterized protein n=1 Tax=Sphagnum magellanicum TaxID=128215 RepID=A0ACB8HQ70_9BRYO|nr:hypothetical protein CY35_07G109500 [Sphagnum magellanicum]